jgi:hypothetical protein
MHYGPWEAENGSGLAGLVMPILGTRPRLRPRFVFVPSLTKITVALTFQLTSELSCRLNTS